MLIVNFFKSVGQVILTLVTLLSLLLSSNKQIEYTYEAMYPDELIMSFSVISDTHIETSNSESYNAFIQSLYGMKGGKDIDATVFLGDNVMNGQAVENLLFYSTVEKIKPADINLAALGNHDVGNGEGDYTNLCENFLECNSEYLDNPIEKPYYYKVINGVYMIFLASEDLSVHSCYISEEQLSWLKGVLDEAAEQNALCFVFNHHPIMLVDGIEWYDLSDLLAEYYNLIYFCGHTHMELTPYSFRFSRGLYSVYLPRGSGDSYSPGIGIVVEVYEDKVLLRPRNFYTNEWIKDLNHEYWI